jgi:uncharacterized membrane protein
MIPRARNWPVRLWVGLLTLAPIVVLALLLLLAPPDGIERAQFLQFIGRFHPLSVHLPIALLIVVPLVELAGRSRYFPSLLHAADFLLGLATCAAVGAAILGWCLARGGGYSGPVMTQHMWGGVATAAAAGLCWVLRAKSGSTKPNRLYAGALVAAVGLVSFTGYRGGQLSQGENHLTEFMPAPLATVLGVSETEDAPANSANGGPATFYGARIRPVLSQHCITCHGRSRHKANLRLDSYEAVMRGGKHGPAVKAGDVKGSELLRRISLASSDDEAMPPDNRQRVSANDRKLIELWIAAGASGTQSADSIKSTPSQNPPAAEVTFEEIDPAIVAKQRAALAPMVAQLQQQLPNIFDYQSRGSADIVVNAAWMGAKFGDNELAALAPLRDRIVMADFSSTAITDKSAGAIAAMKHLRTLRLMHTTITDATVQALGPLEQLQSLDVFATPVTPAALPALAHLPKLKHIYAGETKIFTAASVPQEIGDKLVF